MKAGLQQVFEQVHAPPAHLHFNILVERNQSQGDSGCLVIRNRRPIAKSRPLQHYFDCPLQFGAFPEYVEATDTADLADTYSIPLAPGDVIVAGDFAKDV